MNSPCLVIFRLRLPESAILGVSVLLMITSLSGCRRTPESAPDNFPLSEKLTESFPLDRVEPSKTPPFVINASRDFRIVLGRGRGLGGLDTVTLTSDGAAILRRVELSGECREGSLKLPAPAMNRILGVIRDQGIMDMAEAYHANIKDGTHWILGIRQGSHSKAIYFNNHFPEAVRTFARAVDAELAAAGLDHVQWHRVTGGDYQNDIWNSIQ